MKSSARGACWVALAALAPCATALSQPGSGTAGYEIERTQSVQNAPAGSVGRKTTDREHRVGNAEDTLGHELTYVLVFGGFARRCPTSEGIVAGDFEFSIVYDATETTDDGEIRREMHARRLNVRLEGHVGDDAKLIDVEMSGDFTVERSDGASAPTSERRPVQTRFTPGPRGEPDMPAMSAAVEMTADISVASAILMAGTIYRDAEVEWSKLNECVEFAFDPPTDTEMLGPSQKRQVRFDLHSKEDGAPVPWKSENIGTIRGIGAVEPRNVGEASSASVTLTYTASAQPRRGHGIDAGVTSRGGVANGLWRIVDRYEGTFTQVNKTEGTLGVYVTNSVETLSGRLVWTSDNAGQHERSYGDVPSSFYRPTAGEVTVELSAVNTNSIAGSCETQGRQTFALASLPPSVLQYLLLEIADDGRYKLILAITDYPQTPWEADAVCRIPGTGTTRQKVPAMLSAVTIGIQQGTLNEERAVVGEMPPQQRGPLTTTGNWSFKLAQ
jgi:hypothetical protein